jgi:hypothetical protein
VGITKDSHVSGPVYPPNGGAEIPEFVALLLSKDKKEGSFVLNNGAAHGLSPANKSIVKKTINKM